VWSKAKNTKGAPVVDGWHELTGGLDKDGYRKVILCCNGKRRYVRVGVLVLETFRGPAPLGMEAAHENNVKTDDRLDNLRWDTHINNCADKKRHGTAQFGEKHPQCCLTDKKVRRIRKLRAKGKTWKYISESLGEKIPTVQAAGVGRNWSHIK